MASQFQIEILTVTGPTKSSKGKNTWQILEIAYKKDGKIEGKKLVDFNAPEVFKTLSQAKQGEVYDITSEKQGDYWVWTGVARGGQSQVSPQVQENAVQDSTVPEQKSDTSANSRATGRVTGSNYETSEERGKRRAFEYLKHRQISKQSTLNTATAILSSRGQEIKLDEVIALSNKLQQYISELSYQEAVEGLKNIPDDIPF